MMKVLWYDVTMKSYTFYQKPVYLHLKTEVNISVSFINDQCTSVLVLYSMSVRWLHKELLKRNEQTSNVQISYMKPRWIVTEPYTCPGFSIVNVRPKSHKLWFILIIARSSMS